MKSFLWICLLLASCSKCQSTGMLGVVTSVPFSLTNSNIVADGNSLTYGTPYGNSGAYPYYLSLLSPFSTNGATITNKGVAGQTWGDMISNAATDIDALIQPGKTNILICFENTNTLYYNGDTTSCYNQMVSYCAARKAAGWNKLIICTAPHAEPAANPTPAGDATSLYITKMDAVNTKIRATWSNFADGFVDLANDSRFQSYSTTYYQTDKVHLQTVGYQGVADDVKATLISLH